MVWPEVGFDSGGFITGVFKKHLLCICVDLHVCVREREVS